MEVVAVDDAGRVQNVPAYVVHVNALGRSLEEHVGGIAQEEHRGGVGAQADDRDSEPVGDRLLRPGGGTPDAFVVSRN